MIEAVCTGRLIILTAYVRTGMHLLKILPMHSRDLNRELTGRVCTGFTFAACKYMCLSARL